MKKITVLAVVIMLIGLLAANVSMSGAQGDRPPTIFSFAVDLTSISLPDAEAKTTQAVLTWHVAHVNEAHHLMLYAYQLNGWVLLAGTEQRLEPVGGAQLIVEHPGTFAPPTYRLTIEDGAGNVFDERIVIIPYAPQTTTPTITTFTSTAQSVDAAGLADGSARVEVVWEVANRLPQSNLVFEQILPDGSVQNVELPRDTLWIASQGQGVVAPVDPGEGQPITLRLRIQNVITAEVYDEVLIAIGEPGAAPAVPADTPAPTTDDSGAAESSESVPPPVEATPTPTTQAAPGPVATLVPATPTPLVGQ